MKFEKVKELQLDFKSWLAITKEMSWKIIYDKWTYFLWGS